MSKNIYAFAELFTSIATLLGVVFSAINSLKNGRKIDRVHDSITNGNGNGGNGNHE